MEFVFLGNGRKAQHIPAIQLKQVAHQVVLMEPLHDHNDDPVLFVIQPAEQGVVVPVVHALSESIRESVAGLHGVVDDQDVATTAGQHATDGRRHPKSTSSRHEVIDGQLLFVQPGCESTLITSAGHDGARVASVFI